MLCSVGVTVSIAAVDYITFVAVNVCCAVSDLTRHPVKNPKIIAPICRNTTIEALVCEMMPKPADIKFHMTVGCPCEVPYRTYQPFAGILPSGTVFNEAAEERLKNYNLPL